MHLLARVRSALLFSVFGFVLLLAPSGAQAKQGGLSQTKAGNPPRSLQPQPTKSGHEIGASLRFPIDPTLVTPRFRYRAQFRGTAAQGPLSGLWIEAAVGPSFPYGGGDVFGNFAFNIGYEFDPFKNLALTFSPVIQNDIYVFTPGVDFTHTIGMVTRLYVAGHWVFFVEPSAFGFVVTSNGRADFAFQFGFGFAYKF